jgi:ArsR family transcriptional regulator, arsenate/arsenite/antimonite-responsive transcriptional repressor
MLKAVEKVFKALADKNRLRILKMLQHKSMCVCEIREVLGLAQPTVSKHLRILKEAGLVQDIQKEPWTDYRLSWETPYSRLLLKQINGLANEDYTIRKDLSVASKVNRRSICSAGKDKNKC